MDGQSKKEQRLRLSLEVLGGLAVLVGLIFVGLELRQNTAAMQAATFQDLAHSSSDFMTQIALSPETRRVFMAGWQKPESLNDDERETFQLLQAAYWVRMQNAFLQWQRGTLTNDDWQIYRNVMCGSALSPGGAAHWPADPTLTPDFKSFLRSCGS